MRDFYRQKLSYGVLLVILIAFLGGNTYGQNLIHNFEFNNNLNDSKSTGISLTPFNVASSSFGSNPNSWNWTQPSSPGGGLELLTDQLPDPNSYSIGFRISFAETGPGYKKILSFKGPTDDNGLYFQNNNLEFFPFGKNTAITYAANTFYDFVLTRDASNTIIVYVVESDGTVTEVYNTTDTNGASIPRDVSGDREFRFFMNDQTATEHTDGGSVRSIRVWDGPLSPNDIGGALGSVTTGDATAVTPNSATLNGEVNPQGTASTFEFEYGTAPSTYSSTIPTNPSGSSASSTISVTADVTGLQPGTTYYYRLKATATSTSAEAFGSEKTFTTPAAGGVGGANLWYKADAGVTSGGSFEWANQGSLSTAVDATIPSGANAPTFNNTASSDQINFNPSISFRASSSQALITPTIAGPVLPNNGSGQEVGSQFIVYRNVGGGSDMVNYSSNIGPWGLGAHSDGRVFQQNQTAQGANTVTAGQVALTSLVAATSSGGSTVDYQLNGGASLTTLQGSYQNNISGNPLRFGIYNNSYKTFDITEYIVYPSELSNADRNKVQTYLAIKYGISLGNNTDAVAYTSSNGTEVWTADATYKYDIFGIGKDDASSLNQAQSNSINTGSGDGTGQSGAGNIVLSNPASLDDGDYLLIGHDNAALTELAAGTDLPASLSGFTRIGRQWLVKETGDVGNVDLTFDIDGQSYGGTVASSYRLLIDTDQDGDFTTGQPTIVQADPSSLSGNTTLIFNDLDVQDSDQFTIITAVPSPGVGNDILWLEANNGLTKNASNEVTGWADQAGFNAFTVVGTPTYEENAINFNPVVNIANTDAKNVLPSNRLDGNQPIDVVEGFAVYKYNSSSNRGASVGSTVSNSNYGPSIFAADNDQEVYFGNGLNGTYQSYPNPNLDNTFTINNLDVSSSTTPFATGRLNGATQTVTAGGGGDFSSISVTPMIGGTNNTGGNNTGSGWFPFNGELAEIILYPSSLTPVEKQQVESYLAIKYGITLDPSIGSYTIPSGGGTPTVVWDNTSYWNDVFGIGREDSEGLNQIAGNSINTGSGDGTGQSGKGNIVISNPSSLEDGDFLMMGHDNGALTEQLSDLPAGLNFFRLGREWKVQATGDPGTVDLAFDFNGITTTGGTSDINNYRLLIDEDGDGDFGTGTVQQITPDAFGSPKLIFNGVTLGNGVVIAFATGPALPDWELTKSSTASDYAAVGDVLNYEIVLTNSGNVTIENAQVVDPQIPNLTLTSGDASNPGNLDVGEAWTYTGSHIVTQADIDAGSYSNTATATGTPSGGTLPTGKESPLSSNTVNISAVQTPDWELTKSSPDTDYAAVGDILNYQIVLTNSGNVTIENAQVVDPQIPNLTLTSGDTSNPGNLDVGEAWTYTGSHIVTQADIDAGSYSNTATATGTPSGGTLPTGKESPLSSNTLDIPAIPDPELEIQKSSNNQPYSQIGQVLNYRIRVTNSGNVTITNLVVTDPDADPPGPVYSTGDLGNDQIMAPGETWIYNAQHTIVQDDLDAGSFTNVATATGDPTQGNLTDVSDDETVPAVQVPNYNVGKAADKTGYSQEGEFITYNILVVNTGNITLTDVEVDDPLTGLSTIIPTVTPSQTVVATTTYTVTQADIENGSILNTASVSTDDPSNTGSTIDKEANLTINAAQTPRFNVTKSADKKILTSAGETVNFTIQVENTGNLILDNIVVNDPLISGSPLTLTGGDINSNDLLEPKETWTYEANYSVTQGDIDAGGVNNTVTVSGESILGPLPDENASLFIPADRTPDWAIEKNVDAPGTYENAGDVLAYTIEVENIGNVSITDVAIFDLKTEAPTLVSGDVSNTGTLDVGETWVYTASYTVTQEDVDAGSFTNTADATAKSPAGNLPEIADDATATATPNPSWTLSKDASSATFDRAGQTITYTILLDNTGNVSIDQVDVSDPQASSGPTFVSGDTDTDNELDPNEVWTYTATYDIQQADLDARSFTNSATASGTPPGGTLPDATDDETITAILDPSVQLTKNVNPGTYSMAGEVLTYQIVITNDGNLSLTDLELTDPFFGAGVIPVSDLTPGQSFTYTDTYTVTQNDVDNGPVTNTASVTGKDSQGGDVEDGDNAVSNPDKKPSFEVNKSTTDVGYSNPGDVITYTIEIENTGNVTLDNVSIDDSIINPSDLNLVSGDNPTIGNLDVGETWIYEGNYAVTQDDIDRGTVENVVSVEVTDPDNNTLTDADTVIVNGSKTNSINLVKTAGQQGYDTAGDILSYSILVENNGNTRIDNVVVDDDLISLTYIAGDLSPPSGTGRNDILDPGEIWTFIGSYTVTQDDVDNGTVTNNATVTGTDPDNDSITDGDSDVVTGSKNPDLDVVKTSSPNTFDAVGEVITYTIVVRNPGNVSISDIVVDDPLINPLTFIGDDTDNDDELDPTEIWTYQGTYTITQDDVDRGSLSNTVTVTGKDPDGGDVGDGDSNFIGGSPRPSIDLEKTALAFGYSFEGEVIQYELRVRNNGNVNLENVLLEDPQLSYSNSIGDLAPGEIQVFTVDYSITQEDLDLGRILNIAEVQGTATQLPGTVRDVAAVELNGSQNPKVDIIKSVAEKGYDSAGDVLNYTILVRNTGNVTLNSVRITDPLIGLDVILPVLSVTDTQTYSEAYPTTQDDLNAGSVVNTAGVQARGPLGQPVSDSQTVTVIASKNPSISFVKTASPPSVSNVGDVIDYELQIVNTGNLSYFNLNTDDPLTSLSESEPRLDPGQTITYTTQYTVTQADLDRGFVENDAELVADIDGGKVTLNESVRTPVNQNPGLQVEKTADISEFDSPGTEINYTITVENTGNITVSNVDVSDPKTSTPVFVDGDDGNDQILSPGEIWTYTTSYTTTQADVDNTRFDNTAIAEGTLPDNSNISEGGDERVSADVNADWSITKVSTNTPKNFRAVGEILNYQIILANEGNVTISNVNLTDPGADVGPDLVSGDANSNSDLDVGEIWTYSASYTVTQADLDAGRYLNEVTASGDLVRGNLPNVKDDEDVPALPLPGWNLDKVSTTSPNTYDRPGVALSYQLLLSNTGNVTISNITVVDPGVQSGPTFRGGDINGNNQLESSEVWTYTANYTTDQDDVDNGEFVNVATATGTPAQGNLSPAIGRDTVPAIVNPVIIVTKNAQQNGYNAVSETLNYTIIVRNAGNVNLSDIAVTDNKTGLNDVIRFLGVGQSFTYTENYVVTQADIDAGTIVNTAEAVAVTPLGGTVSDSDTEVINGAQTPGLNFAKGVQQSGFFQPGEEIDYNIYAQNSGNVSIFDLRISDPKVGFDTLIPVLAPNEFVAFDVQYQTTQEDVDVGEIVNVATARGTELNGGVLQATDSKTLLATQNPLLRVSKSSSTTNYNMVGDVINYEITVENTGNVTLFDVTITDPKAEIDPNANPIALLAPGQTVVVNATHTVTQADLDAGEYRNLADVSAEEFDGNTISRNTNEVRVPAMQTPDFTITKSSSTASYDAVNDVLNYTLLVENTGNVTLTALTISDPKANIDTGNPIPSLSPGQVATVTASHTVVQADLDAGQYLNTASGTGLDPNNTQLTRNSNTVTIPAIQNPVLEILKSSQQIDYSQVGERIDYDLVVTNLGNVTLSKILVTDPNTVISTGQFILAPGQSRSLTATHNITQADLDAGEYRNVATVTGQTPQASVVQDLSNEVILTAIQNPGIAATKASATSSYSAVGQEIQYVISVENTGNVTLFNVNVTDPNADIISNNPIPTIAPSQTVNVAARHIVEQDDLDAGSYSNTATATGVASDRNNTTQEAITNEVMVPADLNPEIEVLKFADRDVYDKEGNVINYEIEVTNTGNVTLDNVELVDSQTGLTVTVGTLDPGQTELFTTGYTIIQTDVDAGLFVNSATASGISRDPSATSVQDVGSATVRAVQNPIISLQKSTPNGPYSAVGEIINYELEVSNSGNQTLDNTRLVDNRIGLDANIGLFPVGARTVIPGTYTITQADLDNGSFINSATALAITPTSRQVSASDSVEVLANQIEQLDFTKSGNRFFFFEPNQQVTYDLEVTNTGNVTLSDVVISDPQLNFTSTPTFTLDPGATTVIQVTYDFTQTDLDNGDFVNVATVNAESPAGRTIQEQDSWTVQGIQLGGIQVRKLVTPRIFQSAGEQLVYDFIITNTGNVTLDPVTINDPRIGYSENLGVIAPGASITRSFNYTVAQADVDDPTGIIRNDVTVNAIEPNQSLISATDVAFAVSTGRPAVELDKFAFGKKSGYTNPGDQIDYELIVTNTGDVTLIEVVLEDDKTGFNETIGTLNVGQSITRAVTYTVNQDDIDAGEVINIATVTGKGGGGGISGANVRQEATETVKGIQNAVIQITKSANKSQITRAGEVIEYTIQVENVGNQTLFQVNTVDALVALDETVATLSPTDAPLVYTRNYTVTQADIDFLNIRNTATASGENLNGVQVNDQASLIIPVLIDARLTLEKSADVSSVDNAGEIINYSLIVSNPGNISLSGGTVIDDKIGFQENNQALVPGESLTFTQPYTVTQDDLNNGFIDNVAGAVFFTSFRQPRIAEDSLRIPANQFGDISLKKTVDKLQFGQVGEELVYTFIVTNTGNLTLDPVLLNDPLIGLTNTDLGILQPTESATFTASYFVTQPDLDRGIIRNTASVEGEGPGQVIYSDTDRAISIVDGSPNISLIKFADVSDFDAVGDVINYSLVVENIGNLTLSDVVLADNLLGINQNLGVFAPQDIQTITGSYVISQADLDAGEVLNFAAVAGVSPFGQNVNDDANLIITAVQTPDILLEKTANKAEVSALGELIEYKLDVRNTGNVTLKDVTVIDPLTNLSENLGTLSPNVGNARTTTHAVTQAELDAGFVINTATATGIDPADVTVESQSTVTVTVVQNPTIEVIKSADKSTYSTAGEVVEYTLDVSNAGNVTLTDVTVVDPLTGLNQNLGTLIPGETTQATSTYTVTQADIDFGFIDNVATATAQDPNNQAVEDQDNLTISADQMPGLLFDKASLINEFNAAGEVIDYTLTVTNAGNVTLTDVVVTDPLTGTNQAIGTLVPGEVQVVSTSYTTTQVDMDAGVVNNTATVVAIEPRGQVLELRDSETVIGVIIGEIEVIKTADVSEFSMEGDVITYSFEVTNTGNVTLFAVDFIDPILNLVVPIGQMAPGQTEVRSATYTVTQQDIDEGGKINLVLAEGFDPKFDFVFDLDVLAIPAIQTPDIEITKDALTADYDAPGDVLEYAIQVENTGNVTLLNAEIIDPLTGTDVTVGDLVPGQTAAITTSYTVTQADVDAGSVTNIATVEGTDPLAMIISDADDALVNAVQTPGISLTKTPNPTTYDTVGDVIFYTFVIENTGNVTLDPVELNDPLGGINSQILGLLAPGDSQTASGTYTITQADIDAGLFVNTATAIGTDPNQTDQIATATATVTAVQSPDLSISKEATPTTYSSVGDQIQYEFIITNPGNVTLDQVTLDDPLVQIVGQDLGTLAPAESKTITGIYIITQQDLDNGQVPNTASVSALDPTQNLLDRQATFTINAIQSPSITLEKTANVNSFDAVNDLIGYQLVATNTGNVTLDQVTFNDAIAGINNDVQGSLAPGQSATVTGSYLILQSDLNAGERENTATVTAVDPNNQNVGANDQVIVPADVLPAIELTKLADPQSFVVAGETITYLLTVTNVGNVSLNSIELVDPLIAATPISITDLDPGQSETQTLTYNATQADLDLGQIENTASVTGKDPFGGDVGDVSTEIITGAQNPNIQITKTADRTSFQSVGEVINYTLIVENIGNLTLTDVVVIDDLTSFTSTATVLSASPATETSVTYNTSYTVTQADLDRGFIENLADVNGISTAGPVSDQDDIRINALVAPALNLAKIASPTVVINAGEVVTFTFEVTNVGNVTVENVEIDDPLISFTQTVGDLAPGQSFTTSVDRTVTLDALQQRIFINLATAIGQSVVDGSDVVDTDRAIVVSVDDAGLELVKTPIDNTYSQPGDFIEYELEVINIGNFTLENLELNDPLTGTSGLSLPNILPGNSEVVTVSYAVDQDDIDRGFVTNIATATGNGIGSGNQNQLVDIDSAIVVASRNPSISIVKDALVNTVVNEGDQIPYELTVTNTGNVTLVDVTLNDALTGINNVDLGTLLPGASTVIPTTYTTTQTDFDTQVAIVNTATILGTTTSAIPTVVEDTDEARVVTTKAPSLQVTKTAATQIYVFPGQVIDYEIVVENTGNLSILNTTLIDNLTGLDENIASLAPGQRITYSTSYTVLQSDLDNGSIDNLALANGFDPFRRPVGDSDTETINAIQASRLLLLKAPTPTTYSMEGDIIDYELVVINVGNLTINDITIDDPLITLGPDKDVGRLLPFESALVTGSYTITQADVDNGEFVNIASVTGESSINPNIMDGASATVTAVQNPGISLQKVASPLDYNQAGDVITYDLIVTNTGNLTLDPVELNDPLLGIIDQNLGSFAPGDVQTVSDTYTITQNDVDNGFVENVATVSGVDPNQSTQFAGASATVTAIQSPGISLTKEATPSTYDQEGDVINYNLEVTNTGNVTLDNVTVTDPLTNLNVNIGSLAPQQSRSGVVVYTITQDDLDNAQVINIATAVGTDPNQTTLETTATATVLAIQSPGIELTKTADLNIYDAVDEVITYTLTVTNTGNLTLDNVIVTDPLTGLSDNIGTMIPNQVEVVTATYTVTQADLDNGSITNDAEVTGVAKDQTQVSDQAQVTTPSSSNPALSLTKVANPTTYNTAGEQIAYTLTVSNVGNLTITDVIVSDPLTGTSVNVGTLVPGQSEIVAADYAILQSDVDNGNVVNVATANGLGANGQAVSATASATITAIQDPALLLQKTANVIEYDRAGQVITYTLEITNTGNETLFDVIVTDPLTNLNRNIGQLVPTQVVFVQETYTVTQQDVDNGSIPNVANANGRDLSGRVVSSTDRLEIPAVQTPDIALTKMASPTTYTMAGDVIIYTLIVENTGNVTLTNTTIVDPLTNQNDIVGDLLPGQMATVTTNYVIKQSDVDSGEVVNIATANGTDPNQSLQTATASATVTANQAPGIELEKLADTQEYNSAGDVITYTITVTNTGNVTLSDVIVDDPLTGLNTNVGDLAPDESATVTTSYTITQADVDSGSVTNAATGTGTDPDGGGTSGGGSVTVPSVPSPGLELVKVADVTEYNSAGDVITYTITVTNTGNVTLSDVIVDDPLTGLNTNVGDLAPGESATVTTSYTITQADVDSGSVTNAATGTGTDPDGGGTSGGGSITIPGVTNASIEISKVADRANVTTAGDVIEYVLTVTNTGNIGLENVTVIDPLTGLDQSIGDLMVGKSSTINTSYTVTFDEIVAQDPITNIATATGDFSGGVVSDTDDAIVDVLCTDQTLVIGSVFNQDDSTPLSNVPVALTSTMDGSGTLVLTDSNGEFVFDNIAIGEYQVEVLDRNLNKAQGLYATNGNSRTVQVVACNYISEEFPYSSADALRYIDGFVWYDLNADSVANEWYDANNDGIVTENMITPAVRFDINEWEWIDFNGDNSYEGPQNEGELNRAGFGNPLAQNLEIEGPDGYEATQSIGRFGFWTHLLPEGIPYGEFTITLEPEAGFVENGVALANSGLVQVLPEAGGRMAQVAEAFCNFTTPQVLTQLFTPEEPNDFDFGLRCLEGSPNEIIANDDVFGEFFLSYGGLVGNILTNDLLGGQQPAPDDVDILITDFGGLVGISVDENGDLVLLPGLNEEGTYTLTYTLSEVAFPDNTDDAIIVITIINDQVDLGVEKTSFEAEIYEGDEFVYEVVLSNLGDTDAREVTLVDDLPQNVTYLSSEVVSNPSGADVSLSVTSPRLTWTIPFFESGATITIRVRVKAGDQGVITNVAEVDSPADDINEENDIDDDVNEVLPFRIPNVITPETEDGDNDTFEILGLGKFVSNEIVIINRYGDHVFETENYQNDWDAPSQVAGTYFYILTAIDRDGTEHEFRGWIQVIK